MKPIINLSVIVLLITMTSCGPQRIYTTGTYGSIKGYTEKQHFIDKKTTETYISADVSSGRHMQNAGEFDDTKTIMSLATFSTSTGQFYNYYYGVGALFGTYRFKRGYYDLINDNEKQNFYSINLKTGGNIAYTRPKIDYRFLGLEISYNNEFGPYQDKLSYLEDSSGGSLIIVNQKSMFSYHFYSEYAFKISTDEAITLGFYFGGLINTEGVNMHDEETGFSGLTFGLRLKKYVISVIYESGQNEIRSTKFGLTYQL